MIQGCPTFKRNEKHTGHIRSNQRWKSSPHQESLFFPSSFPLHTERKFCCIYSLQLHDFLINIYTNLHKAMVIGLFVVIFRCIDQHHRASSCCITSQCKNAWIQTHRSRNSRSSPIDVQQYPKHYFCSHQREHRSLQLMPEEPVFYTRS